jgi:hypothetical protein
MELKDFNLPEGAATNPAAPYNATETEEVFAAEQEQATGEGFYAAQQARDAIYGAPNLEAALADIERLFPAPTNTFATATRLAAIAAEWQALRDQPLSTFFKVPGVKHGA